MNFKELFLIGLLTSNFAFGSEEELEKKPLEEEVAQVGPGLFDTTRKRFAKRIQSVGRNVANIFVMPTIIEIMEFYKKNCKCPEDVEYLLFQQHIGNEFKKRVIGQDLKFVLQQYKEDEHGIVSDFGRQLQNAAEIEVKKLQEQMLNFNVPPFSLSRLSVYEELIKEIKKDHPKIHFDDQLLDFASHLFHSIPWAKRQFFSNDFLKKAAIKQIYQEFDVFFKQKVLSNNDGSKIEEMDRFLRVIQLLFRQNKFQDFYIVAATKGSFDFKVNQKVSDKVMNDIFAGYQILKFQPRLKSWQASLVQREVADVSQKIDPNEHFNSQSSLWQQEYEELNKNWNIEYQCAFRALESEKLNFEIRMQEYQELLEKLKKIEIQSDKKYKELLDVEQKNYNKILTNYKDATLQCDQKIQKSKLEKISRTAYQILQDCKCLLQEYENQMQICEQEFIKKLDENQMLAEVCGKNRHIFETIENHKIRRIQNASKLAQKDFLWTKIHEDGIQLIAEVKALEFEKIVQDEKNAKVVAQNKEKNRVSLGVVQRFTQLLLQQRRTAHQAIEMIKTNQKLESLQNVQLQYDSDLPKVPFIPHLSQPMAGVVIPELAEVVVRQPEQQVVSVVRQNNPYQNLLVASSDDDSFPVDQRSVDSAESIEDQIDPRWFVCADGFWLYNCGNGWAQDTDGYWYCFNPATHSWDAY